jgi:hypothetical protein
MPPPDQTAALLDTVAQSQEYLPQLALSQPGVERDGTSFSKKTWSELVWARFYKDKPKKMGGYREMVRDMQGVARHLNIFSNDGFSYVHAGSTAAFERYAIYLPDGTNTGLIDRTPSGYAASAINLWQSDNIWDSDAGTTQIFAAPIPTLGDITSETDAQVYTGDVLGTAILTPAVNAVAASTDYVAFAQTIAGPGFLVLNVGAPIPVGAGNLTITTNGNLTALTTTVTGTTPAGAPLVVGPTALPNNATLNLGSVFGSVSTVAISGSSGANTISVGFAAGSTNIMTSGGLATVGPYLFLYGHDGVVRWSVPFHPTDFTGVGSGDSRPVSDKIVKALPLRGQSAPAVIMWSLSSLIVGNFVGGTTLWNFYTVTTSGSILSQNGVVEHNGIYYWATTNGFSMFSGTMQDIPNEYNAQYFLDNLNFAARQRVFAVKVPRWKEIWWCFPKGNSTECNHAVVYNYDKKYWFDTPLPNGGRGAGFYDVTYRFPIMSGVANNSDTAGTSIWQHEVGVDEVSGPSATAVAVLSSFETHEFTLIQPQGVGQTAMTNQLSFALLEPDYDQVGDLRLDVTSRTSARALTTSSPSTSPYTIPPAPSADEPDGITFQWTGRLTSFKVTSNEAAGDYFVGSPLLHLKPGIKRRTR